MRLSQIRGSIQRPDDGVPTITRTEDRRHLLERTNKEQVQQKRCDDVVSMMAQGNFIAAFFDCQVVQNSAP